MVGWGTEPIVPALTQPSLHLATGRGVVLVDWRTSRGLEVAADIEAALERILEAAELHLMEDSPYVHVTGNLRLLWLGYEEPAFDSDNPAQVEPHSEAALLTAALRVGGTDEPSRDEQSSAVQPCEGSPPQAEHDEIFRLTGLAVAMLAEDADVRRWAGRSAHLRPRRRPYKRPALARRRGVP